MTLIAKVAALLQACRTTPRGIAHEPLANSQRWAGTPRREATKLHAFSFAHRALAAAGIERLDQLTKLSEEELKQLHGIGPNALKQLHQALRSKGLSFAKGKRSDV